MNEELRQRVNEKQLAMSVKSDTDEQGMAGDVSWPGMAPLAVPEGVTVPEYIRIQLLKIGEDIGDPDQFWASVGNGQVMQVFGALCRARMVAEAEAELAGLPPPGTGFGPPPEQAVDLSKPPG